MRVEIIKKNHTFYSVFITTYTYLHEINKCFNIFQLINMVKYKIIDISIIKRVTSTN